VIVSLMYISLIGIRTRWLKDYVRLGLFLGSGGQRALVIVAVEDNGFNRFGYSYLISGKQRSEGTRKTKPLLRYSVPMQGVGSVCMVSLGVSCGSVSTPHHDKYIVYWLF